MKAPGGGYSFPSDSSREVDVGWYAIARSFKK
jgi:hypothetical protein